LEELLFFDFNSAAVEVALFSITMESFID